MSYIFVKKNINVIVSSFGGVGTTFLMRHLQNYTTTNCPHDYDGYKHSPLPPIGFNKSLRFVYIYGDPVLAVISLFRRGYANQQLKKLRRWGIGGNGYATTPVQGLRQYALLHSDELCLEKHFTNWYSDKFCTVPTLFLRYETLFRAS